MRETPNWWPKVKRAAQASGVPLDRAVSVASVQHDPWCARLQGTGTCDCDPDVSLASRELDRDRE